jgi:predicted metal-dependent peptidase
MARKPVAPGKQDPATEAFYAGLKFIQQHPIFGRMFDGDWQTLARVHRDEATPFPEHGWAVVSSSGKIYAHPKRRGTPEEWSYVLAHCLLHLGLGHIQKKSRPAEWNAACDYVVACFLADLKIGRAPEEMLVERGVNARDEQRLYEQFCREGVPPELSGCGAAGSNRADILFVGEVEEKARRAWQKRFAEGLVQAVDRAVEVAAGLSESMSKAGRPSSVVQRARDWFVSSYPLLGSLAASFKLIEDPQICTRMQISVAAVSATLQEIYVNPAAGLDEESARFVLAHEFLHIGLNHHLRGEWREPYLWNVACDFVINGWLVEMGLGTIPQFGGLYDPELKGLSAESIYDRIVTDMRRYRKLATLRGIGLGDVLPHDSRPSLDAATDLDEFYRRCLAQGLTYHQSQDRGLLPAGLVEEIRALDQPPIPWDVELAKWFDERFAPVEKQRTYARPSRRQSATPDIPRASWKPIEGGEEGRTFGVVLDTSGSMDRSLLAKALGAIASYSIAREVPRARVVFCDAVPYDEGYMPPEAILDRVKVRGRGGTILQPGIDLLMTAENFPKDGPILVITDGACDRLTIKRDHAFLLPRGAHLPFLPAGKVFRIS